MKSLCLFLLFFFSLLFQNCIKAQNKGTASFFIKPFNAFLKVDNQVYDLSKEDFPLKIALPEGAFIAELWAPSFEIQEIPFEIKALQTTRIVKELTILNSVLQNKVKDNSFKTIAINGGLIAADIGLTVIYAYSLKNSKANLDIQSAQLEELREPHRLLILPNELENSRLIFDTQKDEFDKQRKKHNAKVIFGGIGLSIAYGFTIYKFIKQSKKKKSRATELDKNPFSNLSIDFNHNSLSDFTLMPNEFVLKWKF